MIAIESYLLLVLMIITAVTLFLCILNALYILTLRKQIRDLKKSALTGKVAEVTSIPGVPPAEVHDIQSGLRFIAEKYHLDSLVIGTRDGLLVSSSGSRNPEYEAAYYSNMLADGRVTAEGGVRLFEFDNRGMPLFGIIRARTTPPENITPGVTTDIKMLFETQL